MKKKLLSFLLMVSLVLSLITPTSSAVTTKVTTLSMSGSSSTVTNTFTISDLSYVTSISVNTGSVTSNSVSGANLTVTASGGSSTPYTPSKAQTCSVNTGSSYPSSTYYYNSGGYSGTLSLCNATNSPQTLSKSVSQGATNVAYEYYKYTSSGWTMTGSYCTQLPASKSYSDVYGYSGTLYKGSGWITSRTGFPSMPYIGQTCTITTYWATTYSGTAYKTVNNYTGNYAGTVYGTTTYTYYYTLTINYVATPVPAPTVGITSPTSTTIYLASGQQTTISLKASGTDCHHIWGSVNGAGQGAQDGNSYSVPVTLTSPGTYTLFVAGRNTPTSTNQGSLEDDDSITVTLAVPTPTPTPPGGVTGDPDTTPPTWSGTLTATPSQNSVSLSWPVATDNVGVVGYKIKVNTTYITTVTGTTYTVEGLSSGTGYSFEVIAIDAAGNPSTPKYASAYTLETGGGTGVTPPTLNTGSTGDDVAVIHAFLGINYGYYFYGALSKDAVTAWQTSYNVSHPSTTIDTDGIVGTQTWKAMGFLNANDLLDRSSSLYQQNLNIAKANGYNSVSDKKRQAMVDLATKCINIIAYDHSHENVPTYLFNDDNTTIKTGLELDCSTFTSSLFYTIYGDYGNLYNYKSQVSRQDGGFADMQSQMGVIVTNLKNSDKTFIINSLKPGDLIFYDYGKDNVDNTSDPDGGGCENAGIYEHVAMYVGDGMIIDSASYGAQYNTYLSTAKNLNTMHWTSPVDAMVYEMVFTASNFIQSDGNVFVK